MMPRKKTEIEIKEYKEFLKSEIVRFYATNGEVPTVRKIGIKFGYPSPNTFFKYFGSMREAIIESGVEIPKEKDWLYNREEYSVEVLLELFKEKSSQHIEENGKLMTIEDMKKYRELPSSSVYLRKFKSIKNLYKEIGIDYDVAKEELLILDLLKNYKDIMIKIGKLPNSREIDRLSVEGKSRYSTKIYLDKFGSLYFLYEKFRDEEIKLRKVEHMKFSELIKYLIKEKSENSHLSGGIYSITNKIDGKRYIGKSIKLHRRIMNHKTRLVNSKHHNKRLQKAWNKYSGSFEFEILEVCEEKALDEREVFYIEKFDSDNKEYGYNILHGNENPTADGHTEETKAYLRKMKMEKVIQYDTDMNYLYTWKNIFIAANLLRLNTTCMSKVCRGLQETTGGFIFRFECDLRDDTEEMESLFE